MSEDQSCNSPARRLAAGGRDARVRRAPVTARTRGSCTGVSQPVPESNEVETWRLLQEVLEKRDREWWSDSEESDAE